MQELPDELRGPLLAYFESRSDEDLSRLIRAALRDFSEEEIPENLPDSASFMRDLGLDSLTITEFVFFFEDAFSVKISNEDLVGLGTVGDLKRFLGANLAG